MNKSLAFCLAVLLLAVPQLSSQTGQSPKACVAVISDPLPGSPVEERGPVSGTAKVPSGGHLWILAHKKLLSGAWWPQANGEVPVDAKGTFELEVAYGIPDDKGDFEVAAVIVSDATSKSLDHWVDTAPARQYLPTRFPPTIEGCVPVKVTVVRR
jgi:hypothetical protein